MSKQVLYFLITICLATCNQTVSAQKPDNPVPKPLNLDSLSAEDKALLVLYKDSFQQDLQDFLFIVEDSKKSKRFDTTVYNMDRSSHVEIGLDFTSRVLSNGRDVGIKGVFFSPSMAYFHKTGLYFALSLGFYTDSAIRHKSAVPLVVPTLGYQHTFFRRWFVGIGYSRSIITYGNLLSKSLQVNNFTISTGVDMWKHLIIGSSVYFNWSTIRVSRIAALSFESHAVEVALSLRKEFVIYKFIGAKVFTITPAITAYFGTDNQFVVIQQRASGDTTTHKLIRYSRQIKSFFGALDIEPSLSIDWRIRNLDIFTMPVLTIPFNTFNTSNGTRTTNPKEYRFYVQAGIKYLFHVRKLKPGKRQ